jgi:hypothetical protein
MDTNRSGMLIASLVLDYKFIWRVKEVLLFYLLVDYLFYLLFYLLFYYTLMSRTIKAPGTKLTIELSRFVSVSPHALRHR